MRKFVNIVIFCTSFGLASCALLFQGTTQEVTVMSDPSGATVIDNQGGTHETPFTMMVPRNEDLQFHFSKPGYQSADVSDDSQIEGGYVAADFFTFLGWPIDAATGAYFSHQQAAVVAHLDPSPSMSNSPGAALPPPARQLQSQAHPAEANATAPAK